MVRVAGWIAILAWVGLSASTARAANSDPDPWLGPDKMLHFGMSTALAAGGYAASSLIWDGTGERLVAGAVFSLTIGAAKELYDMTGAGDPSWRDFAWDVVGTGAGLLLAWGIDELFVRPRQTTATRRSSLVAEGLVLRW